MGAPQDFRQRYIAFKVGNKIRKKELEKEVSRWGQETNHFYDPWLVLYDEERGEGLLKCEQEQVGGLKREMKNSEDLNVRILGLSGTIKKARQKFLTKN